MAGARQPLEVLQAKGRKHLTKAEIAKRQASEIKGDGDIKRLRAPDWLPDSQRSEFTRVSNALIRLMPSMVTRLDGDTIATYCMARTEWLHATKLVNAALTSGNLDDANGWGLVQDRFFKQARACAGDLGLTISARCRLIVPEKPPGTEGKPLMQLLERRRQA